MEFGVYIPQVGLTFGELADRATRCEALGFNSLWLFDHLYAPGLPDQPALEAWTAATAILVRTARLRVGHLVLDNNLRHPALLARMVTTLDHISGGRFEFGIGSGSYAAEHAEGGFPWGSFAERTGRLEEALEIITRMFTGEPVTFSGEHYAVEAVPNVGGRRPRVHIGGAGPRTLRLVARHADVWNVPTYALADWPARATSLAEACAQIGRPVESISCSVEAVLVVAESGDLDAARQRARRRYGDPAWGLDAGGLVGSPEAIVERVKALERQGVTLVVMFPADRGSGEMLDLFAEEVMPHFA